MEHCVLGYMAGVSGALIAGGRARSPHLPLQEIMPSRSDLRPFQLRLVYISLYHTFAFSTPVMAVENATPTETSPLLPSNSNRNGSAHKAIDVTIPHGSAPNSTPDVGHDLERHASLDDSRAAQFAGNPEVQKNLKYLVPATSIGVGRSSLADINWC